ncbi:MAG: Ig-like domain-containing protein [Candidatus Coproplasma sp.]
MKKVSMKKASKRFISSVIALVGSIVLCIGACLAWFATNNEVTGNGMNTQVKSGDIVNFAVTAYYLDYSSSSDNYSVVPGDSDKITDASGNKLTIDQNGDKIINSLTSAGTTGDMDVMRPYSVSGGYTTAVLFKVEYEIVNGSSKKFRIFAECDKESRLKVNPVKNSDGTNSGNFTSYLSNTVTFVSATQSATQNGTSAFAEGNDTTPNYTYTAGEDATAFVDGVGLREKSFSVGLKEGIEDTDKTDGANYSGTEYFIMDYEKERFTYISSLLLESGGGLNSGLTLNGDITLGIEEYTEGEVVKPTSITVDTLAYNKTTAYKQSIGSDIMTPKWQFVVTYSDGTQKVIVGKNSNLTITGVTTTSVGNRTATATYKEGTTDAVTCSVPYTIGLAISGGSGVAKNKTLELSATGLGEDVAVTWSSSDENIATVSSTGVVTGVAEGTVTITAIAEGYSESDASTHYLKAEYVITVSAEEIPITGVTLNTNTLTLGVGNKGSLLATVAPTNATNRAVIWTSSDSTVATVTDGVVTALKAGTATITVTTQGTDKDGKTHSYTCEVTVSTSISVTSVTIIGTETEIAKGGTTKLTATVKPDNANDKTVTWSSSDERVATVGSDGTVTGVSAGIVTITASAGGKSGTYDITVKGVKLDKTSATLTLGVDASLTLTATVYPSSASQTVTWTSDKESVATVENGVVTVVGKGTATITATSTDGSTATCTVTVVAKTYTVTFYDDDGTTVISSSTLEEGATITEPSEPSKTATAEYTYKFDGWYDAIENGSKVTFGSITATANVSYYARYTATKNKYTYTFYVDGTATKTATVDYGTTIEAPDNPEKSGYTFDGWFTEESGGTQVTEFGTISADVNYYAHWTSTSTATTVILFYEGATYDSSVVTLSGEAYNSNTGNGVIEYTYGGNTYKKPLKMQTSTAVTLKSVPANSTITIFVGNDTKGKNGKIIVGDTTYTATDGLITVTATNAGDYVITKGDTLSLCYVIITSGGSTTPTEYTVTFSSSITATGMPENQSITSGGKVTAPTTNPTATGYTFDKWCSDEALTTAFDFANTSITSNTTIYAKWTKNEITGIEVSADKTTANVSDTVTLSATVNGTGTYDNTVTWAITEGTATLSGNTLTCTTAGTVKVQATANGDNSVKSEVITITVVVPVESIALDYSTATLPVGGTQTLNVTFTPTNATNKNVTWESDNTSVATVSNGTITAVSAGTATITVTTEDGTKSATCTVTVNAVTLSITNAEGGAEVGSVSVTATSMTISYADLAKGITTIPDGKELSKITVDGTEYTTGNITITPTSTITATFVTATVAVESISISPSEVTLQVGKTQTLTVTFTPANATDQTLTWTSSNPEIASVSDGVVTAKTASETTVTITATTTNGKTATCTVTVASTSSGDTTMVHNFTDNGTTSTFFGISGNLSTSKGTVTYDGKTLTQCLKMESTTSITFTADKASTLTLVFGGTTSASKKTVKIDGSEQTTGTDGILTIDLTAGSHTITKGDSINLFYIIVTYK